MIWVNQPLELSDLFDFRVILFSHERLNRILNDKNVSSDKNKFSSYR